MSAAESQAAASLASLLSDAENGPVGLIIVDHGSRRAESNDLLLEVVDAFRQQTGVALARPAHMELATPTIADAFSELVAAGANRVVVAPFFLAPGKHWHEDIPALAEEASRSNGDVPFKVAAPLGLHPALAEVLAARITESLSPVA